LNHHSLTDKNGYTNLIIFIYFYDITNKNRDKILQLIVDGKNNIKGKRKGKKRNKKGCYVINIKKIKTKC